MDFELSERSEQWRGRLQAFFEHDVLPCHRDWLEHVAPRREVRRSTGELQAKARAAGLWNRGLSELAPDESGTRLSNLDRAPLAEIMGQLFWAPEFFNCQAPDVPNMIALQNCATPAQKQKWLHPLLNAETRSAFGMTEPDVASSDATNIATTLLRDGDDFVISGRKWFITGAAHPRGSFLIVLGVSHPDADRTRRHSCIIVPMDAPGVRLVRRLRWMGCEDHTAPIGVLAFDNVRASRENLLGADGDGFRAAQVRLGPARIHHCMRSIRLCELLIELMMVRSAERSAFGRPIIQYDTVQRWSAESRVELKQARLLCLSLCLAVGPDRPSRRKFFDKVGATCRRSTSPFPPCCSGSPTAPCRCSARWAAPTIRLSTRRWPRGVSCGSATGRTRCICGRSSRWRRYRAGESPIRRISPRIPREPKVLLLPLGEPS
jgi:acyl-CoA dehydrogenase